MSKFCEYPENNVDEIIPGLWLGDEISSYNETFLKQHNIKYIIRVLPETDQARKYDYVTYIHLPIKDESMCQKDLNNLFEKVNYLIKNIITNKCKVLVHCKRGHHRSAAFVAAFLIRYLHLSFRQAVRHINKIRPCALRRDTCMTKALYNYYILLASLKSSSNKSELI